MSEAKSFTCRHCGAEFTVPQSALDKFPGWKPARCFKCKDQANLDTPNRDTAASGASAASASSAKKSYDNPAGDRDGIYTDGACSGNPGPGGWGAILVRDGKIVAQRDGFEPQTTNNRMELSALIAGFEMIGADEEIIVWSDSQLCVNTINEWAPKWKKNNWRRKGGEIANLDLVQKLYQLVQTKPRARLVWLKGHAGLKWNEFVDKLATARLR